MSSFHPILSLVALVAFFALSSQAMRYPLADERFMRHEPQIDVETVESVRKAMKAGTYPENDDNPFKNSGYFTTNETTGANLFYLFFEAQNGNKDAPVFLWLNGGPGCSSMDGAFEENLSPFHIDPDTLELVKNEHSWSDKINMLFVDNPQNTGFSYSTKGVYVNNMEEVAQNLYSALIQFFDTYPQYKHNEFYISGESYAGNYVPSIAYKIQQEGYKINLKGITVGDGLTHPDIQMAQYSDSAYANGLVDDNGRAAMERYEEEVRQTIARKEWSKAGNAWGNVLQVVQDQGGVNLYDIRTFINYDSAALTKYLNQPHVQQMMHTTGHRWTLCDGPVYSHLANAMPQSQMYKVVSLLNEGKIRVLLYNGLMDIIIPTAGAKEWIKQMPWNGKSGYNAAQRMIWRNPKGEVAGYTKSYGTLTQLSFRGAGHMVPMDQVLNSIDMIEKFLIGHEL